MSASNFQFPNAMDEEENQDMQDPNPTGEIYTSLGLPFPFQNRQTVPNAQTVPMQEEIQPPSELSQGLQFLIFESDRVPQNPLTFFQERHDQGYDDSRNPFANETLTTTNPKRKK